MPQESPLESENLTPNWLDRPDGDKIAYHKRLGRGVGAQKTGVMWLGGFKSDMGGNKALAVDSWAARTGRPFVRFDYFGHGQSSGDFAEGTIGRWADDALAVLDEVAEGPQILLGSSMGGWISLLTALARPEQVAALALLAPAPDFTEDLMWGEFSEEIRAEIEAGRPYIYPSDYDEEPYMVTPQLIKEGRQHLVLREPLNITCPVRILHGMADPDVPWERSLTLCEKLNSQDVVTTFVKDGDHRLSDEANLGRLLAMLERLCGELEGRS